MLIKITRTIDSLEHYIPKGRVYMKSVKNINYKVITIMVIIIIPILLIAQYYLFKFGAITPMVKGIEIEMEDGDYVKDIDKFVMKLNDTVTLSTGEYVIIPSYAKNPNIYFKVLDNSNILSINGNEVIANQEGTASIGVMKNSRILKKINIKVVNPKVESLTATLDNDIKYVGESAKINSEVQVDYDKFKEKQLVTYESSDENILKIEGNVVEAVGVGKASLYIKAGDKETVFDYNIQAKIAKISIPSTIKIAQNETKKLNPKIITEPKGLKHGKIKYELVDRKVTIDYAISLSKDGTITGSKEGTEKVRITCGDKQKIVTIKVEKESIIDKIIKNIMVNYEIINGKLSIDISWDYIKDINNKDTNRNITWSELQSNSDTKNAFQYAKSNTALYIPMSSAGATYSVNLKTINVTYDGLISTQPLSKIETTASDLNLLTGNSLTISNIRVKGINKAGTDYIGFNQDRGHWIITSADGKEDRGEGE